MLATAVLEKGKLLERDEPAFVPKRTDKNGLGLLLVKRFYGGLY